MSNNQLTNYEIAKTALAKAKAVDEVKEILNQSKAMQIYAQQAKDKELELDAAEIRMRAERRLGELIRAQKETVGLNPGARGTGSNQHEVRFQKGTTPPTLAEAGIDKKLSSRAQKMAAVPEEKFEGMIGEWRDRIIIENERVTTNLLRVGEREQLQSKLQKTSVSLIGSGKYPVLLCDPPWRYEHIATESRAIENQYPTMTHEELCELPVNDIALDDCVLFLWATSPKLGEAFGLLSAWGFDYRTCAVWDKEVIGMGYYFRQQHELLLVAVRGNPATPLPSNRTSSVLRAKRGKHSEKPVEVYQIIESMYPNMEKMEMFARTAREGWNAWGFEAQVQSA